MTASTNEYNLGFAPSSFAYQSALIWGRLGAMEMLFSENFSFYGKLSDYSTYLHNNWETSYLLDRIKGAQGASRMTPVDFAKAMQLVYNGSASRIKGLIETVGGELGLGPFLALSPSPLGSSYGKKYYWTLCGIEEKAKANNFQDALKGLPFEAAPCFKTLHPWIRDNIKWHATPRGFTKLGRNNAYYYMQKAIEFYNRKLTLYMNLLTYTFSIGNTDSFVIDDNCKPSLSFAIYPVHRNIDLLNQIMDESIGSIGLDAKDAFPVQDGEDTTSFMPDIRKFNVVFSNLSKLPKSQIDAIFDIKLFLFGISDIPLSNISMEIPDIYDLRHFSSGLIYSKVQSSIAEKQFIRDEVHHADTYMNLWSVFPYPFLYVTDQFNSMRKKVSNALFLEKNGVEEKIFSLILSLGKTK